MDGGERELALCFPRNPLERKGWGDGWPEGCPQEAYSQRELLKILYLVHRTFLQNKILTQRRGSVIVEIRLLRPRVCPGRLAIWKKVRGI